MEKGLIYEGVVEQLQYGGKSKVFVEGEAVEVKNVLPGQKIRLRVTKNRRNKKQGKVLDIIERSPLETEDTCKHFGRCGGCFMQSIAYEKQLSIKESQIKSLFENENINVGEFLPIIGSPKIFEYRNKMEFTFGDEEKNGPITLGMHKKGLHHDIVTVDDCQIMDEDFRRILIAVLEYAKENSLAQYNSMRHEGFLRHLVVRKGHYTKEIIVHLITTTQDHHVFDALGKALQSLQLNGEIVGFLHSLNDGLADVVQSDEMQVVFGKKEYREKLFDLTFEISPYSFFQTNTLGAERLYREVIEFLGDVKGKTVLDLYSGTGTIAQVLAKDAKKVIGIELVEEAVEKAKENAKINNLDNCTFIAGDVKEKMLETPEKPDALVIDPPREGIHDKALGDILSYHLQEMVYVSCNPKTLVKNLKAFQEAGYEVIKARGVDLFPHTSHVETIVLLTKAIENS